MSEIFLKKVGDRIFKYVNELDSTHTKELFSKISQGKMLRSKLVFATSGDSDTSVTLCSIIELIHLASLLHDDVIDDSLTRRGAHSINAIYGNKNAIMLGDILYSKAYFELTKLDRDIAQSISNAVTKLSIGELLDVELSREFNENIDRYMEMIYKKTASLIESTSQCAAIISNKDVAKFKIYGKNLGIAFQIVDDILDITQDSQTLGKPALNDFREGKTTLPYILLYKKLENREKEKLLSLFKKEIDKESEIWIREKMLESGALKDSIHKANEHGKIAIESIKDEGCENLVEIVEKMIKREY